MWRCFDAWSNYNLANTLRVSYTYPLFKKVGNAFVKIYGFNKGLKLKEVNGKLCFSGCCEITASMLSGLWFNPYDYVKYLSRSSKGLAYELLDEFDGVSVSIDPWDLKTMFVIMFLSRNTDFHKRTVPWVKTLINIVDIEHMEVPEGLDLKVVGSSYQIFQLNEVLSLLNEVFRKSGKLNNVGLTYRRTFFNNIKEDLLKIKFVGPKTVYAFALYALGLTTYAPVDRHFADFLIRNSIADEDFTYPNKKYCLKYNCLMNSPCPLRKRCLFFKAYEKFDVLTGWVQAVAYYIGKLKRIRT